MPPRNARNFSLVQMVLGVVACAAAVWVMASARRWGRAGMLPIHNQGMALEDPEGFQDMSPRAVCRDRLCMVYRGVTRSAEGFDRCSDWLYCYLSIREIPYMAHDAAAQDRRANALWARFSSGPSESSPLLIQVMDVLQDKTCMVIYQDEFLPVVRAKGWRATGSVMAPDWRERTEQVCREPFRRLGYEVGLLE